MKPKLPKLEGNDRAQELLEGMDRLRRAWAGVRPEPPLTRGDMMTLGALDGMTRGGQRATMSHLAHRMHLSLPGASQKVSALEELGYLRRVPDKRDRRVTCVELTDEGRRVAERALRDFLGRIETALDTIGPEKTDTLLELMRQLSDAIQRLSEPAPGREE